MKRILIIEDDQVAGNVSYNHLMAEGFHVKATLDGESGLQTMRDFKPDLILLDLILPKMSGLEVIKQVRSEAEFAKIPIIVFSNAYLTSLVQDAWKAGATKCISKANCSTRELIDAVRRALYDSIRDRNAVAPFVPQTRPPTAPPAPSPAAPVAAKPAPEHLKAQDDSLFESDLRQTCIVSLPATLASLRTALQTLVKADGEVARLKEIFALYRRVHALAGNAAVVGLVQIGQMAAALEALLKELNEKPASINPSTLRTIASAVDFLGYLFQHGTQPGAQQVSAANILVVDDETISRRAVVYALEKAQLESISVDSAEAAYPLLVERPFDLVFLDVDMPGMTGLELCTKLRALPAHKKTPVVFVTALSDFDSRTSSTMAGGNDFIAKPFLFIELTVKALIHVLRGKVPPVK
jgi:DNA-binding response OmpR family regulator